MEYITKLWANGDSLKIAYSGNGNGKAVLSTEINEGADREMEVKVVEPITGVTHTRTCIQIGYRLPLQGSDGIFMGSDGRFLVLKEEYKTE